MQSSEKQEINTLAMGVFNTEERTISCPYCHKPFQMDPLELRKLAGMLMGSSKTERKSRTSRENGIKGGRYKSEDPAIGGIIAPATASRLVSNEKAQYGDYISGKDLSSYWETRYGLEGKKNLELDPAWNPNDRYRIVFRQDIKDRVDFYNVDYYKKRKLNK